MRRKNLTYAILMVFSIAIMLVSGAIFVYSAQQQSVSSSLSVTFSGENVNFTAQGWYHVKSDANNNTSKVAMVNSSGQTSGITFSATDAPKTETLKISNTESENKAILTATQDYVLFTYKFVNTASNGAFGMEVTLELTNVTGSNLKAVKYGTASSLYADANLDTVCSGLSEFSTPSEGTMKIFDADFIAANNGTCYYYILLQLDDPTLPVTFNPTFSWTVVCSDEVEKTATVGYEITLNFTNLNYGYICGAFEIWEDSSEEAYYSMGELYRPANENKKIEDFTSRISEGQITSGSSVSITTTAEIISILILANQTDYGDISEISVSQYGLDVLNSGGGDATRGYHIRLSINTLSPTHTITFNTLRFHAFV